MSLTLVVYLPGAGGNHLKNLLCLSNNYANSGDLVPDVYENPDPRRPPGEVWCVGGRNLQDVFFDRMIAQPDQRWVLAAHLGEMFQYRQQLQNIVHKQMIVITLDDASTRQQLYQRQTRLGQNIHPYWLDEEFLWMYQSNSVCKLFDQSQDQLFDLSIRDFWNKNFVQSRCWARMCQFLSAQPDSVRADCYHKLWYTANQFE